MHIVVTGSIATDHLMTFPGRFADQLIADQLEKVSLSFLVDELEVRRGGVGANIAFGLGRLGLAPVLVGAVGADFDEYRTWLDRHGVDTASVHVSTERHTSRFLCTTDLDQNQIASFYAGAMAEAREIDLSTVAGRVGDISMVLIGPNDPEAMLRHTRECREHGHPFAADPSQQLARMSGEDVRALVDGAAYLFTNEYESTLLMRSTGWSREDVLQRVGRWITTCSADGVRIESAEHPTIAVPAAVAKQVVEPTGVGDGFRAGFLAGLAWDLDLERSAQLGCMLATVILETTGTQEYAFDGPSFAARFADAYGPTAAADVDTVVRAL